MINKDFKEYYKILGLKPNASISDIKSSFRRKAMTFHPDRNFTYDTTEQFKLLNEAYSVLSNDELRAEYDSISSNKTTQNSFQQDKILDPIICSCCRKITAQPRYVIFFIFKSFIFKMKHNVIQGVFCSFCANKKSLNATLITCLFGWWGIPFGFFYTIQVILNNIMGGEKPASINAALLTQQAFFFTQIGKTNIAYNVAIDALKFNRKIKPYNTIDRVKKILGFTVHDEGTKNAEHLKFLIKTIQYKGKKLKNNWRLLRPIFYIQTGIVLTSISVIIFIFNKIIKYSKFNLDLFI